MEFFVLNSIYILYLILFFLKFETISKNFIFIDKPDGKLKKTF